MERSWKSRKLVGGASVVAGFDTKTIITTTKPALGFTLIKKNPK